MTEWVARAFPHLRDRERVRVLALAVAVGVLGGGSAVAFEFAMDAVALLVFGTADPALGGFSPLRAVIGPVATGLAAGAAATLLTTTGRPQGIAELIAHARGADDPPTPRNMLASALAAVLTIGGGQSAGREGPIVQIAGSLAATVCDRAAVPPATARVLAAAGAAGAIAASFNSPLGGAFFALEVILGTFALEAFAPVVVASVTGTLVGQLLLGERLALQLPGFHLGHASEILLFPVLGVACGLVTVAFRALVVVAGQQLRWIPGPPWVRPAVAGACVGALAAAGLPDVMGNGYARLEVLIGAEHPGMGFLVVLLAAKLVATALSAASRSGGGMFAPSLFLGAVTGLLCGRAFAVLWPGADPDPGTFATVGMAGVAAALAHAPATMALMLAEMTGNYTILLPLLVTIAIASLVTQTAFRHSLYVQALLDRGVRLDRGHEELVVTGLRVEDLMLEDGFLRTRPETPFGELAELFLHHRQDEVFVVDAAGALVGLVDIQDVKGLIGAPTGRDALTAGKLARAVPTLRREAAVGDAMEAFFRTGLEALPVTDAAGTLSGVLTERDVLGALNREILGTELGLARIGSGPPDDRKTDFFELPAGYAVTGVPAAAVAGRTLADLDLTRRSGVVVLAIDVWDAASGRATRVPPAADQVLGPQDRLVVMGPADRVAEPEFLAK